jgi:hypothetical protein
MKKALNAPVKFWQLIVVSVLVAVLTSTATVSAAPYMVGVWPTGSVRMSGAFGTDTNSVTVPKGYTPTVILQKTITVPAGKVADIAVIGMVNFQSGMSTSYIYCFGRYRLDNANSGTKFRPGDYILEGFNPPPNNLSVPLNGYLQNVAAGNHTIYMVADAGYADCVAQSRSMIILMNVH